jgi:hypothetical protein
MNPSTHRPVELENADGFGKLLPNAMRKGRGTFAWSFALAACGGQRLLGGLAQVNDLTAQRSRRSPFRLTRGLKQQAIRRRQRDPPTTFLAFYLDLPHQPAYRWYANSSSHLGCRRAEAAQANHRSFCLDPGCTLGLDGGGVVETSEKHRFVVGTA